MLDQVKWIMVDNEREVCGSVRVGRWNPKVCGGMIKVAIERKEAAWKEVLGARDEGANERCMET